MEIRKNMMKKIKTALISVSDKSYLKQLLQVLKKIKLKSLVQEGRLKKLDA